MDIIRSLWHLSAEQSVIKEESFQKPSSDYCKIQSQFSLVSSGTERLVARGEVPKSVYNDMEAPYMEGAFSFPIKYGYSLVGKVIMEGHPLNGKIVHALHPHQDICFIKEEDLFEIPSNIPEERATLASNLETALTAIWDAKINIGDRVLVVGFGMIGALVARLLSFMPAVEIYVVEIDETRCNLAKQFGFQVLNEQNIPNDFDAAFHTTGTSAGLQTCIDSVGFEGKIIELSWYGSKSIEVILGGSFHSQRKQIIGSQVGKIPSDHRARWDFKRRKKVVFELLKNEIFDQYITDFVNFVDTPAFFADLRAGKTKGLVYCIVY